VYPLNFLQEQKQQQLCVFVYTLHQVNKVVEDFLARCRDCQSKACKEPEASDSGRCASFLFLFMLTEGAAIDHLVW